MLVNALQEVELDDALILDTLKRLGIPEDAMIRAYNNLQTGKCNVTKIRVSPPSSNIKESFVYEIMDPELGLTYHVSTKIEELINEEALRIARDVEERTIKDIEKYVNMTDEEREKLAWHYGLSDEAKKRARELGIL